jgi:hypothetical protein
VAAVPLAVYAAWYVTYGHDTAPGSHPATLEDPLGVPRFAVEGVAASLSSTLGLRTVAGGIHVDAPTLFLLALAALVVSASPSRCWSAVTAGPSGASCKARRRSGSGRC